MRTTVWLSLPLLTLAACASASRSESLESDEETLGWDGRIETWGSLREALREGRDHGRVALADFAKEGTYAIGALAELRGEITVVDGEVWVSEGHLDRAVTTREASAAMATVLFAAEVSEWTSVVVENDVDPSELDFYLAAQGLAAGLDPTRPFPFVVEGELRHLELHVIAGECPMRARMLGGEMSSPPYRLHADAVDGRLVGIFAPDSPGIICHMGSKSHVHALLEEGAEITGMPGMPEMTGHVETVGLAKGSVLKLPRP